MKKGCIKEDSERERERRREAGMQTDRQTDRQRDIKKRRERSVQPVVYHNIPGLLKNKR